MAKKVVKKRKIKLVNFLIFVIVLAVLSFCVYLLIQIRVKNILVIGNNYINDDTILEIADIKNYPGFLLTSSGRVERKLLDYKYIKKVNMSKTHPFTFRIELEEAKALFYDMNKNSYIFNNNKEVKDNEVEYTFRVPRLINYVPDKKYKKFIVNMDKVNPDTISKISDIEYQPNDYDKDRFLLYMDDSNMVYLTLTKFKMINHYNEVYKQLENHKGILYLDSGNHFQIKE